MFTTLYLCSLPMYWLSCTYSVPGFLLGCIYVLTRKIIDNILQHILISKENILNICCCMFLMWEVHCIHIAFVHLCVYFLGPQISSPRNQRLRMPAQLHSQLVLWIRNCFIFTLGKKHWFSLTLILPLMNPNLQQFSYLLYLFLWIT